MANKNNSITFSENTTPLYNDIVLNFLLAPSVSSKFINYTINEIYNNKIRNDELIILIDKLKREVISLKRNDYFNNENASDIVKKKINLFSRKFNIEKSSIINLIKKEGYNEIFKTILYPFQIKEKLDKYIIGQEELKKVLANIGFIMLQTEKERHSIPINLLLIANTGQGKTYSIKILAKILNIPITIINSSMFVESGIVGTTVSDALTMHYQKCDYSTSKMERSIIFFDEFDKLANSHFHTVQDELLSLMNRDEVTFNSRITKKNEGEDISANLTKTIFVFAGTFSNLRSIKKSPVGFNDKTTSNSLNSISRGDFQKIGIKQEIIGRMNSIITLNDLEFEDYINIIKSNEFEVLKQYNKLLKQVNKEVIIEDEAYKEIAISAIKSKEGVRYINTLLTDIFQQIIFDISDSSKKLIRINSKMLKK